MLFCWWGCREGWKEYEERAWVRWYYELWRVVEGREKKRMKVLRKERLESVLCTGFQVDMESESRPYQFDDGMFGEREVTLPAYRRQ